MGIRTCDMEWIMPLWAGSRSHDPGIYRPSIGRANELHCACSLTITYVAFNTPRKCSIMTDNNDGASTRPRRSTRTPAKTPGAAAASAPPESPLQPKRKPRDTEKSPADKLEYLLTISKSKLTRVDISVSDLLERGDSFERLIRVYMQSSGS